MSLFAACLPSNRSSGTFLKTTLLMIVDYLQTLSPDTMDTDTAAKVCVIVKALSVLACLVVVWMFPDSRLCPGSLEFCEYFQPWRFYIYSLPFILTLIIVLGVITFTMYRAHTFVVVVPTLTINNDNVSDDPMSQNVDIMVESEPSLISLENFILNEAAQQPAPPMLQNFLSPLISILDILYKYLRVTVLSLCLLSVNLPEHIMIIITWSTGASCRSQQFVWAVENVWVPYSTVGLLLVPYLVKRKLDRFSD